MVLWTKGRVEFSPGGSTNWYLISTNQVLHVGDQLRTGERSRATLRLQDLSVLPVGELTTLQFVERPSGLVLQLLRGVLSFFHRGRPGDIQLEGGGTSAVIRGTEFVFAVDEAGTVNLTLLDGQVDLANLAGALQLHSGETAVVRPGEPPRRTASILSGDATAIQWALYYPAILDLADVGEGALNDPALHRSVQAYLLGNLPRALAQYPAARTPSNSEERLYLAALLLSVGNIEEAQRWLGEPGREDRLGRLARAHGQLIATVTRRSGTNSAVLPDPSAEGHTPFATEWLAHSYALQGRSDLAAARQAARFAVDRSPQFAFAWARLAELEFSFGRIVAADAAVARARELAPQNAEAAALQGFLLAAKNQTQRAQEKFAEAIALDGALGNAWLGRGLTRIRQGDLAGGRADLEVAAAAEPQRAVLRSYLGKAFADESRDGLARHELALAQALDPSDPTVWLYRSLLAREQNRVNDALRDLAQAESLHGNRSVFRSRLLLDQDRAVSAANQAVVFRDAGLAEVGLQAASRSVALDYANASAHQFLADSYASSERVDLRFETPRVSEYLLANLLAPVGGGLLSASLSQQEYSKLFERDGASVFSDTSYLSRGAWSQSGGSEGTFGQSAFLAEGYYASDPGYSNNDAFRQAAFGLQFKQQMGARDSLYFQALGSDLKSGDLARYADPHLLDPDLEVNERLEPVLLAGWHRAWTPQSHTLVLAGLVRNALDLHDPTQPLYAVETDGAGRITDAVPIRIEQDYASELTLLSLEAQQIWQSEHHLAVAGLRYQHGEFEVRNFHGANDTYNPLVLPPSTRTIEPHLDRIQLYAYDTWRVLPKLSLTAGLSFDEVCFPENFRYAPLAEGQETRTQLSPKIGLLWEAAPQVILRAAYSRALAGVSFDQSYSLEPTQVAGFNQSFRSLIPESLAGATAAPELETARVAVETRPARNTWLTLTLERLTSDAARELGVYAGDPGIGLAPASVRQHLDFEETALQLDAAQLVGRHLALSARYRLSRAELDQRLPSIPDGLGVPAEFDNAALLHELRLAASFNHESGFFATIEANWLRQMNQADVHLPDEDIWQFNLMAGYRFARRRAQVSVGVLNLTDQDYRLNPVNFLPRLERERTFFTRLIWRF